MSEILTKDKNYAKVIKITGYPIKGHKYRMDMILPSKINQKQLSKKAYLDEFDWSFDSDRYNEVLQVYLNRIIEDSQYDLEIAEWEIKQVQYKPDKIMKTWLDIFEVKKRKPVKFSYYFYTKIALKKKDLISKIKDSLIDFGSDFLCTFVDIRSIRELPKELKRETIAKIPLTEIIQQMKSEETPHGESQE